MALIDLHMVSRTHPHPRTTHEKMSENAFKRVAVPISVGFRTVPETQNPSDSSDPFLLNDA